MKFRQLLEDIRCKSGDAALSGREISHQGNVKRPNRLHIDIVGSRIENRTDFIGTRFPAGFVITRHQVHAHPAEGGGECSMKAELCHEFPAALQKI
ncbi:hypothetical protein [Novosphingobium sp. ZW T3_23]|uniref:hypothetical protein n=1 Tax=Novosphingobium sp. ZW T3_23 TaxID=3378084 RepID=UPI0038539727